MDLKNKLLNIQQELKAPKERNNRFGGYFYRSTEDILTALKPLLKKNKVMLTITDTMELIGDRYYVKATVCLEDVESETGISVSAYARETLERKKSDDSQLTGAASSYARKYALNGLFLIDDSLDPDTYEDDPEGLAAAKASNLKTYGHEDGPTPDELYEKYGSWTKVLQKSFSPNMGMDACCGLYDEYYWLYIELGYVEAE